MSWLPDKILSIPKAETDEIVDKATVADFTVDCEESKTCSRSDKLNHVYALLLLIRDFPQLYNIYSRRDFAEVFLAKLADICTGNFEEGRGDAYYQTEWYQYVSTHTNEFCVESKYSDMLYNEDLPILDVLMMLPWKYLWAYGL